LLKEKILNPEALVVEKVVRRIGHNVGEFKIAKYFSYKSYRNYEDETKKEAEDLSKKLFSNPIIEKYTILSVENC